MRFLLAIISLLAAAQAASAASPSELLEQGMATADPAKRAAIYSEFARVLNQEVLPYAYLFNVTDTIVAKKHVKGLTVIPDGLVRFADMYRQ